MAGGSSLSQKEMVTEGLELWKEKERRACIIMGKNRDKCNVVFYSS
jgi:hypothetical protein